MKEKEPVRATAEEWKPVYGAIDTGDGKSAFLHVGLQEHAAAICDAYNAALSTLKREIEEWREMFAKAYALNDEQRQRLEKAEAALQVLLASHNCWTKEHGVEIPEEISGQFDVTIDAAKLIIEALEQ